MAKEQLIPEGKSNVDTSPNFSVRRPSPSTQEQWDQTQADIRATHRPEDQGELQYIKCITPRGATFTAKVYRPVKKQYETNEAYARRAGRVQTIEDYRHPGDGWRDDRGEPDEMSYFTDPRNGARRMGKDEHGNWMWPVEIQSQDQRKQEIVKTWWHRDLAEYCGKPLPDMIRLDQQAELSEFRAWKASQPKK